MSQQVEYALQISGAGQTWEIAITKGFSRICSLPFLVEPEISCTLRDSLSPHSIKPQNLYAALRKYGSRIYGLILVAGLNEDDTERLSIVYLPGDEYILLNFPNYDAPNEISERCLYAVRKAFHLI